MGCVESCHRKKKKVTDDSNDTSYHTAPTTNVRRIEDTTFDKELSVDNQDVTLSSPSSKESSSQSYSSDPTKENIKRERDEEEEHHCYSYSNNEILIDLQKGDLSRSKSLPLHGNITKKKSFVTRNNNIEDTPIESTYIRRNRERQLQIEHEMKIQREQEMQRWTSELQAARVTRMEIVQ